MTLPREPLPGHPLPGNGKPPAPPGEPPDDVAESFPWDDDTDYDIGHETAIAIDIEVMTGTPIEESPLTYTADMRAFRAQIEKSQAWAVANHPNPIFYLPNEIPPDTMSGERGVGRSQQPKRNEDEINKMLRATPEEQAEDPFADRNLPAKGAAPSSSALMPSNPHLVAHDGEQPPNGAAPGEKPQANGGEMVSFGPGRTSLADKETDPAKKPVDYYVDIDFPPLEQKDAVTWVDAMTKLAQLLPPNDESQKLVISMALNALGVNDVDQVVDRIMTEMKKEEAKQKAMMGPGAGMPGGMPPAFMPRLPPGQQMMTGQPPGKPGQAPGVREAAFQEHGDKSRADYWKYHPETFEQPLTASGIAAHPPERNEVVGATYRNVLAGQARDNGDGTITVGVAVKGAEHSLYADTEWDPDEGREEYNIDMNAAKAFERRVDKAYRDAGFDVTGVKLSTWDAGWGTQDVTYEVTYRVARGPAVTPERLSRIIEVLDDAIQIVEHGDPDRDPNYARDYHPGGQGAHASVPEPSGGWHPKAEHHTVGSDNWTIEPVMAYAKGMGGGKVFGKVTSEGTPRVDGYRLFRNGKQIATFNKKGEALARIERERAKAE